jgi:hypothetical protein
MILYEISAVVGPSFLHIADYDVGPIVRQGQFDIYNRTFPIFKVGNLCSICYSDSFSRISLFTGLDSQFVGVSSLFSHLLKLLLNQAQHSIGLFARILHAQELSIHDYELLSRIARVATIRYGDDRCEENHEFVPVTGHAPRLLKSFPAVHVLTIVCFFMCVLSTSAFIWVLVQDPRLFLLLILGFSVVATGVMFNIALNWLDRITLNL